MKNTFKLGLQIVTVVWLVFYVYSVVNSLVPFILEFLDYDLTIGYFLLGIWYVVWNIIVTTCVLHCALKYVLKPTPENFRGDKNG